MTIKLPPLPGPFVVAGEFYPDTPDFYAADQLRTAQREAALMALEEAAMAMLSVHGHQTINNQEFPKAWHEGVSPLHTKQYAHCAQNWGRNDRCTEAISTAGA